MCRRLSGDGRMVTALVDGVATFSATLRVNLDA
jgi:hypothetical protein